MFEKVEDKIYDGKEKGRAGYRGILEERENSNIVVISLDPIGSNLVVRVWLAVYVATISSRWKIVSQATRLLLGSTSTYF